MNVRRTTVPAQQRSGDVRSRTSEAFEVVVSESG